MRLRPPDLRHISARTSRVRGSVFDRHDGLRLNPGDSTWDASMARESIVTLIGRGLRSAWICRGHDGRILVAFVWSCCMTRSLYPIPGARGTRPPSGRATKNPISVLSRGN